MSQQLSPIWVEGYSLSNFSLASAMPIFPDGPFVLDADARHESIGQKPIAIPVRRPRIRRQFRSAQFGLEFLPIH